MGSDPRQLDAEVAECGATYELANGETVSPCHLRAGHAGKHEGRCLGSRCTWESDEKHSSEYEAVSRALVAAVKGGQHVESR